MHSRCIQHAAIGVIERMLIAEAILRPGSRQVDIAKDMMIDSSGLGSWSYWLGKAQILDRRLIGGRVFLAPGKRCEEVGLNAETAASMVTLRHASPESWESVV